MSDHTLNFLRANQQESSLTHEELASLIGQCSHSSISYYQSGVRQPTLEGALALQVLFDIEPRALFPGYYSAVEELVMQRAKALYDALRKKRDPRSRAKLAFLDSIPGRNLPNAPIV